MASKVVAVTGASGFIGAHVVLALLRRGYTVHACVRNKDDAKNKFLLELGGPVRLFSALLLDEGAYDAAFAGAVGVIHVAAVLAIAGSMDPVRDMVEPSTRGTRNVLEEVAHEKLQPSTGMGPTSGKPQGVLKRGTQALAAFRYVVQVC